MFLKFKNKLLLLLTILFIIPTYTYAYSDYIIAGGENIGIELKAKGIIIVGSYNIGANNPLKQAKLQNGDIITKVNNNSVETINDMLETIKNNNSNELELTYLRSNKEYNTTLSLTKDENGILKTGLYVKDSISGVGTLTFIDPNTKLYGALGHEIIEKNTGKKLEIKDGKIYNSSVTSITRSTDGNPGEKNAKYNYDIIYGNIKENTTSGIFGNYTYNLPEKKLYKVANSNEIKLGNAKILTVINDEEVKEYNINILKINKDKDSEKNILFEITDQELLNKTGGIIQGMSGSPIIQDNNIIGAVTHVVVDEPAKGYGIFIVSMLEEAEN